MHGSSVRTASGGGAIPRAPVTFCIIDHIKVLHSVILLVMNRNRINYHIPKVAVTVIASLLLILVIIGLY